MSTTDKFFEGKISVREFLVDFFGALMPGVFFLIFVTLSFIVPAMVFIFSCQCYFFGRCISMIEIIPGNTFVDVIGKIPVVFDIAIFLLFLTFSYVAGTLFYRRDPKDPDYKSFIEITKKFSKESDLENWVARVKEKINIGDERPIHFSRWKKINFFLFPKKKREIIDGTNYIKSPKEISTFSVKKTEIQFPYNNLKGYLMSRGWKELAALINWHMVTNDGTNEKDKIFHARSKTFINALKIRLQFHCPEQCSTIIKNEAHIRLSSSMWYVSKSVLNYGLIGFLFTLIASWIYYDQDYEIFKDNFFCLLISVSISLGIVIISYKMKIGIEKFFHYQRVREIFYVLETSITAAKFLGPDGEKFIFHGVTDIEPSPIEADN